MNLINSWDHAIEAFFDTSRPPALVTFFRFITHLGDIRILAVVGISLVIVLYRHKRYPYAAGLAVTVFGSLAAFTAIKHIVERARPGMPFQLLDVTGYSFPSGHATSAMAMYGFMIFLAVRIMHPPHHRRPLIAFLVALILIIGFSRVYIGVHYASDVVVGWALGAIFVYLGMKTTDYFRRGVRDS